MSSPTQPEESDLLPRAQAGDTSAREELVRQHSGLVWSAVRRFSRCGEDSEDLFQIGALGLLKAIDRFDPSYKVQFSTYAVPLIVGEIRRYLRDQGPMRVARSLKSLISHIARIRQKLMSSLGYEPSVYEIAHELDVSPADVAAALDANRPLLHLEEQIGGDTKDPVYLQDRIAQGGASEKEWVDSVMLRQSLEQLDPRLRHIMFLRFFADRTQAEIAREVGVSQAQVSRLEQRGLALMRRFLGDGT